MNLYFFGGSFDPPHGGHLEIIRYCLNHCDKLILIPVGHSPLKDNPPLAAAQHRIKLLELLIQDLNHKIEIDDWEISQTGTSFTYLTVKYLNEKFRENQITLVIGADQLTRIKHWKNYQEILETVKFLGFNRRDKSEFQPLPEMQVDWVEDFDYPVSSRQIRKMLSKGKMPAGDLPAPVQDYIRKNNLYGWN